ncbi:MAG: hypothetical protein QOI59_4465 [Gammaproteobacteria bacterium]|jgi:hypothetical protein|nr:hypothetical protein [Gammaproteobacteria bacterium]
MIPTQLRVILATCDLAQADFARLIGVSPRAVSLWLSGAREMPGPAEAYLRLFQLLPKNLLRTELARLNARGTGMRDGMFGITYQGQAGAGTGILIFDSGRVYGTDEEGARYDGSYLFDEDTGHADVTVKLTFPPQVPSVFGITNQYEWSIDVRGQFDPKENSSHLQVTTSLNTPLQAQIKFLRALPDAA